MIQVLRTAAFDGWLQALRDKVGQRQVLARLTRLSLGNWGGNYYRNYSAHPPYSRKKGVGYIRHGGNVKYLL